MKSESGARINALGGFIKRLPAVAATLVFIANIFFGFFWLKGFYYCGKVIAWICIAALVLLLLFKLAKLKFWGRLKRAFTDDDESAAPPVSASKATPDPATAPKATPAPTATPASTPKTTASTTMTKEEYEKESKALLARFEEAIRNGDAALENEIKAEMQELKKRAPKTLSDEEIKKKVAAAQSMLNN